MAPTAIGAYGPWADLIVGERPGALSFRREDRCSFYPGPHKFDLDMQAEAFDWFDRWLKG